ncbi:glycosyltransferase family 4 protein [Curtobacterium sp. PhB115]|uniref:glycosyltransferase family 4 protein n=1 Tax=Curtobacterium sp. PhB115 TaxID=2485173 RepID=UPI000F4CA036|nr:glycosyltransferase family 4 protein [Curtobacterium sp. PhB115]ROP74747.1 glycosyltransferase involved in cell wall biosynthesis [Curtobacterium sp. PhB115]
MQQGSLVFVGLNYPPEPTGIAPYTGGLASSLAAAGVQTSVLTAFPHYPDWSFGPEAPPSRRSSVHDDVHVTRLRHVLPARPVGVLRLLSELTFGFRAAFASWRNADVVVLVSPALFSSAVAMVRSRLRRRSAPVVTWVQDLYSLGLEETGQGGFATKVVRRAESWLLRNSDAVVVIHDRFKDHVVRELGVRHDQVVVIRNWSHVSAPEQVDRQAVRARLGWQPDETVVLHAGNIGVKQGLENVVEAARLADERQERIRFVLLGGGNQRQRLQALGADVERLVFLDSLPDEEFVAAMNSADVLLVNEAPGISGMAVPSKLTSYFSTGLPVLASTEPGSVTEYEVLTAGAGRAVPAGDPSALLDEALLLGADEAAAREFGKSALSFLEQHLTPNAALMKFGSLFASLRPGRFDAFHPKTTQQTRTD